MSVTVETSNWMAKRDELTAIEKDLLDAATDAIVDHANDRGIQLPQDDRFANVEAAIIKLIFQSRK